MTVNYINDAAREGSSSPLFLAALKYQQITPVPPLVDHVMVSGPPVLALASLKLRLIGYGKPFRGEGEIVAFGEMANILDVSLAMTVIPSFVTYFFHRHVIVEEVVNEKPNDASKIIEFITLRAGAMQPYAVSCVGLTDSSFTLIDEDNPADVRTRSLQCYSFSYVSPDEVVIRTELASPSKKDLEFFEQSGMKHGRYHYNSSCPEDAANPPPKGNYLMVGDWWKTHPAAPTEEERLDILGADHPFMTHRATIEGGKIPVTSTDLANLYRPCKACEGTGTNPVDIMDKEGNKTGATTTLCTVCSGRGFVRNV